ncbi:TolC family protein, partial [Burkholderia sp. SIMBA_013]
EAEAASQGALAHFDGVVLDAIRETQTGLAQYSAQLQRRDALADAEQSAQLAADQTHRFFQAGRASFLADLQATRTYTDMRAQLAAANTQVAMSQIDLFLALGGGWESGRTQGPEHAKP